MLRKLIIPCLVVFGFTACRAAVRAGPVHAGAGVSTTHR
jgi:hypothetical protein